MNISELQGWLTLLLTACAGVASLIFCYFKLSTNAAKEVYKAEKKEVLNSVAMMLETMKEFRVTQKEQSKTVADLTLSVLEVKIQIATHKELLEKFFREMVIDTGDGFKVDPRKANKQR
jgi:hypothetical protein